MADRRRIGRALLLRRRRGIAALAAAIVGFGALSSSVGVGALPVSTLPVYGVTDGDGSRATVAELGDINGDGIGDYAVGLPSATVGGSADAGVVDVFLGHAGALPPTPTPLDLTTARSGSRATTARCWASPSRATTSTATASATW